MMDLLRSVRDRRVPLKEAARILRTGVVLTGRDLRFDIHRYERTGLPEVVLAEGKTPEAFGRILRRLHQLELPVVASRLRAEHETVIRDLQKDGLPLKAFPVSRLASCCGDRLRPILGGHRAAVLAAGTSDVAVAQEAADFLGLLGADVETAYDVGVAGLHRLVSALTRLRQRNCEVYVVMAGREGALPTVVAGLVDRPVIGVPVSVGYGRGAGGESALTAMLQSCAPLAVVNIDGGIPAAMVASQIMRQRPRRPRLVRARPARSGRSSGPRPDRSSRARKAGRP